jgi:hypothetical protein
LEARIEALTAERDQERTDAVAHKVRLEQTYRRLCLLAKAYADLEAKHSAATAEALHAEEMKAKLIATEDSTSQLRRVLAEQEQRVREKMEALAQSEESGRLAKEERDVARDMLQQAERAKQWAQERGEDLQTQVSQLQRTADECREQLRRKDEELSQKQGLLQNISAMSRLVGGPPSTSHLHSSFDTSH